MAEEWISLCGQSLLDLLASYQPHEVRNPSGLAAMTPPTSNPLLDYSSGIWPPTLIDQKPEAS